jgi:hypothetical protein
MEYRLQRTFQGVQIVTPQHIEFEFPKAETVSRYFLSTNAVNWKISGTNTYPVWTDVDTRSYIYNSDTAGYQISSPVNYKYFKFESNLVQNSNNLTLSSLVFTNTRGYTLSPNLTSTSTFSTPLKSNPSSVPVSATFTSFRTNNIEKNDPIVGNVFQWSVYSNVLCSNLRFEPYQTSFTLLGSNNDSMWVILAQNSNTCTRLEPSRTFRLITTGQQVTRLRLFDPIGNDITSENGGAFRGVEDGEWLRVEYGGSLPASVYSIRTIGGGFYPTWWVLEGSTNGTSWIPVDERRYIYDDFSLFADSFQLGTVSYKYYRLIIKAFSGSTDARISSFSIYDDRGTLLTPITSSNSFNPQSVIIPTSSSNVITGPGSPFINGVVWPGGPDNSFVINFDIPVSVHKVYMDTNSPSVRIVGDGVTLLDTSTFNKVAALSPLKPRKRFVFSNVGSSSIVSDVMLFGSDGARLNPFFTDLSTFDPSYGGPGREYDTISIKLPPGSSNGNLYSFVSHISSWKLDGNVNGVWRTLDDVSNVYEPYVSYQRYIPSSNCTDYTLTIRETKPTNKLNHAVTMNCFQIFSNSFSPMIPTLTANITDVTDTIVSTSLIGQFSISCSVGTVPVLKLFKIGNTDDVTIDYQSFITRVGTTELNGSFIDVKLPYVKAVNYYQLTIGSDSPPTSWNLLGSLNNGTSWSNILSSGTTQTGDSGTIVRYSSNSTPFSAYRLIFGSDAIIRQFSLFGSQGIITPDGSESSYGNELYGGQGNEWIQIKFPLKGPAVSKVRLESPTLPSSVRIIASNSSTAIERQIATFDGYSTATSVDITVNPLTTDEDTIRVYATSVVPNKNKTGRFLLSNIGFYDVNSLKLFKNFTPNVQQTDPLNQIITLGNEDKQFGGPAIVTTEKLTVNIYPNTSLGNYYVFRSNFAKKWTVSGSTNNSTWDTLDTRNVTQFINDIRQRPYMFYTTSNLTNSYSWFRVEVQETFPTSDGSININEFGVYDNERRRLLKFVNENDTTKFMNTYSTGQCTLTDRFPGLNDTGEYLWWTFDKPSVFSNATITISENAYMSNYKFIGKNTGDWSEIYTFEDKSMLGTFVFGGQIDDSPVKAFTTSGICRFSNRASNIAGKSITIDLPSPIEVGYYTVSMPSRNELGALVAGQITRVSLNDQETSTVIAYGSNAYIPVTGSAPPQQSYTFKILATDIPSAPAVVKNIVLHDKNGFPLYDTRNFAPGNQLIQTIEKPYAFLNNPFTVQFTQSVEYSNIAMIIKNYDRDPYQFDGRARVGVSFQPTQFRGTGNNQSFIYDNDPTDVIEGSESVILGNESNKLQSAISYQFNSTNANVWSLYGSTDGENWTPIESNVSGSKTRTNIPSIPSEYYKLVVEKINNNQDGTTNISNFKVGEWPPLNLTSNETVQQTPVTSNSYTIRTGQIVTSS